MSDLENIVNHILYPQQILTPAQGSQSSLAALLAGLLGLFSFALASAINRQQNITLFAIKFLFLVILFLFFAVIYLPAVTIYWSKEPLNYSRIFAYLNWRIILLALTLPLAIIGRLLHCQWFYSLLVLVIFLSLISLIVKDISRTIQKTPLLVVTFFLLPFIIVLSTGLLFLLLSLLVFRFSL